VGELRYAAWGGTRYAWGSTPTDYRYTGQREEAGIGLSSRPVAGRLLFSSFPGGAPLPPATAAVREPQGHVARLPGFPRPGMAQDR